MGGTIASTFLTLIIVPLIYYMTEKKKYPVKAGQITQNQETESDLTKEEEN